MMKRTIAILVAGLMLCFGATTSMAATVLSELSIKVNGTGDDYPYGNPVWPTIAGFDTGTGIGTITRNYTGAGSYNIGAFFDHDILPGFGTDYGTAVGSAPAGVTWQIDDPWFGTIYANVAAGTLDNTNYQPYVDEYSKYNVSMALAQSFTLDSTHKAKLVYTVSGSSPNGFYLQQTNADTGESIYLSSTLDISAIPTGVPEPSTIVLLGLGVAGLVAYRKKRTKR